MNKLSLTDAQLNNFRGEQGILLQMGTTAFTPSDILMQQVEKIERLVNTWVHMAVMQALGSMRVGIMPGVRFHLMADQISAFRVLQAESIVIAADCDMDRWKLHQFKIEQWVSDHIDQAVINATAGLIKIRGN